MTPDEPGEAFPEQPFLTHLIELRSRLLRCLWAVGIFAGAADRFRQPAVFPSWQRPCWPSSRLATA